MTPVEKAALTTGTPNTVTIRAMEDATSGKNLSTFGTVDEFFMSMKPWWKRAYRAVAAMVKKQRKEKGR